MGDSVTGFDASKYMYDKSAVNTNYATSASEGDSSSPSVESVDLSNDNYASPTNGGDAVDIAPPDLDNGESIDKYINVRADVNGDGVVNLKDASMIQKRVYGYISCFPIEGDINGDGSIKANDYVLIKNYIMGNKYLDGAKLKAADINRDGNVKASDYVLVKNNIMGSYTINQ